VADEITRRVSIVKVVNNNLGDLKMSDDDGSNPVIVKWEDYKAALQAGETDDSQHLDVEITQRFWVSFASEESGGKGQIIQFVLDNEQVEELFDSGGDKTMAVRTDPFQAIVNVSLGGLAAEFGDKAKNAPGPPKKKE
jgi:hypothetical protein